MFRFYDQCLNCERWMQGAGSIRDCCGVEERDMEICPMVQGDSTFEWMAAGCPDCSPGKLKGEGKI